ncbi:MAG: HlyD family secretion protein [Saprospiraceae bacterium]|jgi:HlyD family secretion protein
MAKKKNNKLIFILIGAILLLVVAAVVTRGNKSKGEKVSFELAEKRTIKETVSASGKVYPETEVKITSDVSGEIIELHVEEGDSVTMGQLLAKIDPDAYQSQVERGVAGVNNALAQLANSRSSIERSKAQLTQAIAQQEQIEAQLNNTKAIHERNIKLHKEGVISDADFETSLSNLEGLKANYRSNIANVKTAEANLESAKQSEKAQKYTVKSTEASLKELKTSLRRTTLFAPNDGVISLLTVEQGERVVGTSMMSGTEMMRIANLSSIEVQVDVSENDVLRVSTGDPVDIEVDAYLDRIFKGVVTQVANSASNTMTASLTTDQVTNFIVKIRIDTKSYEDLLKDKDRFPFRPGMSASVEIYTNTEDGVLSVPIQSVTTREDKDEKKKNLAKKGPKSEDKAKNDKKLKEVIFVCRGDSAIMVEVKTGIQDDSYIQVLEGVKEGDEVITGPYNVVSRNLKDGDIIKKVDEDELYGRKED